MSPPQISREITAWWKPNDRVMEISYHTLSREEMGFLWDCYVRFKELVPNTRGLLGENLILMWKGDHEALKAEVKNLRDELTSMQGPRPDEIEP